MKSFCCALSWANAQRGNGTHVATMGWVRGVKWGSAAASRSSVGPRSRKAATAAETS